MHAHAPSVQIPERQAGPIEHADPAGCAAGHAPSTHVPTQQSESLPQLPCGRQHLEVIGLQTAEPLHCSSSSQLSPRLGGELPLGEAEHDASKSATLAMDRDNAGERMAEDL